MRVPRPLLTIFMLVLFAAACSSRTGQQPQGPPRTGAAVTLVGAGATFPFPLYSKWAQVYQQQTGVRINYQSIGSGGGIRQFIERTVDFGATDGPMDDQQIAQAGGRVLHVPTVAGAVVLAYSIPGVGSGLNFTPEVLAGIFLGEISMWNDPRLARSNPNATLPAAQIVVVHRSDGSGTTRIWTNYLSKVSPAWKARVGEGTSVQWPTGLGAKGNEGVAELVSRMPNALGYVELAYVLTTKLTYGTVRNASGRFVRPSLESTTAAVEGALGAIPADFRVFITNPDGAQAYPISGFTWILIRGEQSDQRKGKSLVDFLWWLIHDGQQHAPPLGYAPLPAALVQRIEQALESVTANGKPLL